MERLVTIINITVRHGGRVVTGSRGVLGSNPDRAASELGNSVYPALPVSFGGHTFRRSLLSGVYARGSKSVTCRGLGNKPPLR